MLTLLQTRAARRLAPMLVVAALCWTPARAGAQNAKAIVEGYAAANKLPIKQLDINLPGRKLQRLVVPVLPNTAADFTARFSEANGCMVWRQANDNIHVTVNLGPQKYVSYGSSNRGYNAKINASANGQMTAGNGHYLALALGKPALAHFENFLKTTGATGASDMQQQLQKQGKPLYGGCMWWLVNGEVGPGLNLAHAAGVTRSQGPPNLFKKLAHAGNAAVAMGVAVPNVEAFNKLTIDQLLGPPPGGGAADAVK